MNNKHKIIVILGQTSTGKSEFAVEVSKKLKKEGIKSEIISADSRQVYKGMNLGTGKITKKEMSGIPHHLLDIISPKKVFSVNDFQKLANKKIKEIFERNNIPIICGGAGFYIDTLINNISLPKVAPNKKLREQLATRQTTVLLSVLKKLNPEQAKIIDSKNKVRLIRAIEISKALNENLPATNSAMAEFVAGSDSKVLKIGLTLPSEILKDKIYNRIISRIKEGMLKEIKDLHLKGLSWKRMVELGLEYRYGSFYLQKKLSKKEMIEKLNTETWHFAKRQKTWFKRDQKIIWINPLKEREKMIIIKEIKKFLKEK